MQYIACQFYHFSSNMSTLMQQHTQETFIASRCKFKHLTVALVDLKRHNATLRKIAWCTLTPMSNLSNYDRAEVNHFCTRLPQNLPRTHFEHHIRLYNLLNMYTMTKTCYLGRQFTVLRRHREVRTLRKTATREAGWAISALVWQLHETRHINECL